MSDVFNCGGIGSFRPVPAAVFDFVTVNKSLVKSISAHLRLRTSIGLSPQYHPTEMVSDKISSMLLFNNKIALHITRGVRWDSDHVVILDDETKEIAKEIVRADALDRVFIATDYFDASINRISAWVTGIRSVQKALLYAMLEPSKAMKEMQNSNDFTSLMVMHEELKTMPFGDVWEEYLKQTDTPIDYLSEVKKYENEVLKKRV